MPFQRTHPFNSPTIPIVIKALLILTGVGSILSPLIKPYFALSLWGLQKGFFWQFFTYPWIDLIPGGWIQLLFHLYLIWAFGTSLIERIRNPLFLTLYLGSTLIGGILGTWVMYLFQIPLSLSGSSTPLYALLMYWSFVFKDAKLLLFFIFPFEARILIFSFIGIQLFTDLFASNWISIASYGGAVLFASILYYKDRFLVPLQQTLKQFKRRKNKGSSHIYDIHTQKPLLDDDAFMDAMLTQISKEGEESLSKQDKIRMQLISERKRNKKF